MQMAPLGQQPSARSSSSTPTNNVQTHWWVHHETSEAKFATPQQAKWEELIKTSHQTGVLGAADEWGVYEDVYKNTFYYKEVTNDFRWDRPADAIEKDNSLERCTRLTFGAKAVKQNWYSCEGLTDYLRVHVDPTADRFKACMPCAKKLLNEVHECVADEERGHPALCHSGLGVHTARLKYIRSS